MSGAVPAVSQARGTAHVRAFGPGNVEVAAALSGWFPFSDESGESARGISVNEDRALIAAFNLSDCRVLAI